MQWLGPPRMRSRGSGVSSLEPCRGTWLEAGCGSHWCLGSLRIQSAEGSRLETGYKTSTKGPLVRSGQGLGAKEQEVCVLPAEE